MTIYAFNQHIPRIHPSVFTAPSAQITGNARIGRDSSVWFQTVIPPWALVAGTPARIKKIFDDPAQMTSAIQTMSESYMNSARAFSSRDIFHEISSAAAYPKTIQS